MSRSWSHCHLAKLPLSKDAAGCGWRSSAVSVSDRQALSLLGRATLRDVSALLQSGTLPDAVYPITHQSSDAASCRSATGLSRQWPGAGRTSKLQRSKFLWIDFLRSSESFALRFPKSQASTVSTQQELSVNSSGRQGALY